MPIYAFEDEITGGQWELMMTFSERACYLQLNPNVRAVITAPKIVSGVGDSIKADAGFNDMLKKVADQNPHSPLANNYGSKDTKSVKTRQAVDKARKNSGGAVG